MQQVSGCYHCPSLTASTGIAEKWGLPFSNPTRAMPTERGRPPWDHFLTHATYTQTSVFVTGEAVNSNRVPALIRRALVNKAGPADPAGPSSINQGQTPPRRRQLCLVSHVSDDPFSE